MEDGFLQDLDAHLSNIGSDEHWIREIGGKKIWFSPIPFDGQTKVNEVLGNESLKTNVFSETKRVTLSYAIVGIDTIDLRQYRNDREIFPVLDARLKKEVKVSLNKYLYVKLQAWGAEFIDIAFDVFADLMQTFRRTSMENCTLENVKDPMTELAEIESRAAELRRGLGLPALIEARSRRQDPDDLDEDIPESARESEDSDEFNPFKTVRDDVIPDAPKPVESVQSIPIPAPPQARHASAAARAAEIAAAESDLPLGSPGRPHVAIPSVSAEVMEPPVGPTGMSAVRPSVGPMVDHIPKQSVNTRFHKPGG